MNEYMEISRLCKEQNVDTKNCHIYILGTETLDGDHCPGVTVSQDDKWMCIPTKDYCPDLDEYVYVPMCYQIKERYKVYLSNGYMYYLVQFCLLYKRKL